MSGVLVVDQIGNLGVKLVSFTLYHGQMRRLLCHGREYPPTPRFSQAVARIGV